jgi:hypothetical protein
MLYLLEVDVLVAALIFGAAGFMILTFFVLEQARALVAARHRIYDRLASLTTQPQFFANPLAISRSVSRTERRDNVPAHRFQ